MVARMDASTETPLAVACSLSAAEMPARLAEIAAVGRQALTGSETSEGRTTLWFAAAPEIHQRLDAIVQAESACCSFLQLRLEQTGEEIRLHIGAPADAHLVLAEFVEAFSAQVTA
jgi:hypothetical protein